MKIVGMHIDLKAQMPKVELILEEIRLLASKGYNTILLEYEDKFPFQGELAKLSKEDAMTMEDVENIKSLCKELNMTIIPLVQSIGHMYWVTCLEEFAWLGEAYHEMGPGSHSFCASKPESFETFQRIIDQVLEVHKDCRYIHIGGDEVAFSDSCPLCKDKDKTKLLADYYKKVLEYIRSKGFIPAMWGDMLLKYEGLRKEISKDTLIFDWQYNKGLSAVNMQKAYGERQSLEESDDTSFSTVKMLTEEGFKVIVAPAVRSYGDSCFLPRNIHLDNCMQSYYVAEECHAEGVIVTDWAVRRGPGYLNKTGIWAVGALAADPAVQAEDILKAYAKDVFGTEAESLVWMPVKLADAVHKALQKAEFLSSGANYMDPVTGHFPSFPLKKRLGSLDIRDNTEVKAAYENMYAAAVEAEAALKEALPVSEWQKRETALWHWSVKTAKFMAKYVSELCDHYADSEWIRRMQAALDEVAQENEKVLTVYYSPFTLISEKQMRTDIHKEYLSE